METKKIPFKKNKLFNIKLINNKIYNKIILYFKITQISNINIIMRTIFKNQ